MDPSFGHCLGRDQYAAKYIGFLNADPIDLDTADDDEIRGFAVLGYNGKKI